MRKFSLLALALVVGITLAATIDARQDQDRPERKKQPDFQQFIAVNYILVDVIVTDRDGNYVRNLTKDDFEVFENGKPVSIESLDEYQMMDVERADVIDMPVETFEFQQPPRNIIIFFDLLYSSSYGIKRAVEMVEKFVLDRIQPGDRVMVMSYYNSLETIQPFTSDKMKVIEALRKTGFTTDRGSARLEAPTGNAPQNEPGISDELLRSEEMGERILESQMETLFAVQNARNYMISMQALAKVVKQYPGRKTLIILSEGMDFDLIDPIESNYRDFGPEQRQQGQNPQAGLKRMRVSLFTDWEKMLETMNDAKVSMYTVNIGGLQPIGDASRQYGDQDQSSGMQDMRPQLDALKNRQNFLSSVSVETGGRAYFNTNNILELLNRVEVDISNYYILGFRSNFNPSRSEYRRVSVKVKQPGLKVLHRKGFYTPRPFNTLSADERDIHLTEGFLHRSSINELDAAVDYQFIRSSPTDLYAGVCIKVPAEILEVKRNTIDLEVLASNINSEGKIFSSAHKRYRFPDADNQELQSKDLRLVESLNSDKGINRIRIALRDNNTGKKSYFYYNYVFRESVPETLLLSQPFFFDPGDMKRGEDEFKAKVEFLKSWNEPPTGGADLLAHPRLGEFCPTALPEFRDGDTVSFFVALYNTRRDIKDQSELKFELAVSPAPEEEKQREFFRVTIADPRFSRMRSGDGVYFEGDFPMSKLEPGLYDLYVVVTDNADNRKSASTGRFRVVN